jgi:hypothetical protein
LWRESPRARKSATGQHRVHGHAQDPNEILALIDAKFRGVVEATVMTEIRNCVVDKINRTCPKTNERG